MGYKFSANISWKLLSGSYVEGIVLIPYNTLFRKVWVDKLITKITLPAGATDVYVSYPHRTNVQQLPLSIRLDKVQLTY